MSGDLLDANRTYHEAQSQMELLPNYYRWIYGAFRRYLRGTVVELGCGAGLGISTYLGETEKIYAVDHNDALLAQIAAAYPADRVTPLKADLLGAWSELDGIAADTVVMMDVLEHFSDDLAVLKKAGTLIKPGGHIVLKVPAQSALYSPMDEASGHYRRYDLMDIDRLAAGVGLDVIKKLPINRAAGLAYRMKNRQATNFSKSFAPWQLRTINTLLPLVRLVDLVVFLPGHSIAAVLKSTDS